MSVKPVLVIGDACVDLVVQIPEQSGNAQQQSTPELYGGGTGANTAVALARLGVSTAFMGSVGSDGYGHVALTSLQAEGVDISRTITRPDAFTTVVLALIDAQGERTLFGWPRRGGAHVALESSEIELEHIEAVAWLHTTGMCMVESPVREAVLRAMALAQAAGVPTSFDLNLRLGFEDGILPESYLDGIRKAISLADYVFGSAADELAYLTEAGSLEEAARLLADNKRTMVARLGEAGAQAISAEETVIAPAFSVEVVDTLGAGDAFNAGFIAASIEGKELEAALRWGNAVAALKLGQAGARGVPYRADVEQFLKTRIGGEQ